MTTYEKTHPWLKFKLELSPASIRFWIILGECQSKCQHIAESPLTVDAYQKLHSVYLAKGVHATTAIEGNTLSEAEIQKQIEGKLETPPSRQYLQQETQNIIDECNRIAKKLAAGEVLELTVERIKQLNRAVLQGLTVDDHVVPGEVCPVPVGVARYRGAPRADCEHLLGRLCEWLNGPDFQPAPGMEVVYAVIKAVVAHLYLAWIHPFGDGNGRTARLIELQILLDSGVPTPAAHLLSNHYNLTRAEYYRQLDRASASGGDAIPFIEYSIQGFVDGLREQLGVIREQQMNITWRDYVYETFRGKKGPVHDRRRSLVLGMYGLKEPASFGQGELLELNPHISRDYASKTTKTLTRDLNELIKMGLVSNEGKRYRACRELVAALLPLTAPGRKICAPQAPPVDTPPASP